MQPHEGSSNLMLMNSAFSHLVIHSFIKYFFGYPPNTRQGPGGTRKNDMHSLSLRTTNQPTELLEAFHSVKDTVSGWLLKVNAYESH